MTQFQLAPGARLNATLLGQEQEPLLQSDGILADPDELVRGASASDLLPAYSPAGGFPGLRSALPSDYIQKVVNVLTGPIAEAFSLGAVRPIRAQGAFSLVTLPPDALAPPQRAPHVDSVDPMQFAILHYLCGADHGGTSFYRHRATGFETLSPSRLASYDAHRAGEATLDGYVEDGAPWFEPIMQVSAEMNRLIVYRSCVLHSGRVPSPERLSPDPATGRLTANIFVTFAPASLP